MWGRIYPHAVFLIFANIMLEASCKGGGSLTFVIDDTLSMADDIKHVKRSVYRIQEIVLNEPSSLIDNMVLVTFNDPGVYEKIVTNDSKKFYEALKPVKAHTESKEDCWEPAMEGLLLALNKSKNDSFIFVFTDAPAKDYNDSQSVIEMCQKKQTQIVFVLTGTLCKRKSHPPEAIDSYYDIAAACSGLAFYVQKKEVDKVFGPIQEIIKGNKNVITTATVPAGIYKNIPFTIDDYTDYVIVYASGINVSLTIKERSISLKSIMSTDNAKVIKLTNAKPGSYVATVKGATRTSVIIVGRTDFIFSHGFSETKPMSLSDTSPQPISDGAKVYLSISVRDDQHSVKIKSAQLLEMDGKPILSNLTLSDISKDFYVTDPFVAPSQRFKVAVNGIDTATGKTISRTAKIPVTPPPPKKLPEINSSISTILESTEGDALLRIPCIAAGLPKPSITWKLDGHVINPSTKYSMEDGTLIIKKPKVSDTNSYTCEAKNEVGTISATFKTYIRQLPQINSRISTILESTEGDALLRIPCIAAGLPKPSITWKLDGHVINPSTKYSMEDGTLIIKYPKVSDTNSYTCEAKNEVGTDSATFKTYIRQFPKLSGVAAKNVSMGKSVNIECKIVQGKPTPKISWQFMDKAASKFVPIAGVTTTLRITNAENKQAGRYKCVAQNDVGRDEYITTLIVESLPRITINSTTVEGIQGDLALKIPCNVVGVPQPTITWKINGTAITPNEKYSIEDGALVIAKPVVNDSLLYTCEAKNYIGSISATFQARVAKLPEINSRISTILESTEGDALLRIPCIAAGLPKPSITWKLNGHVINPSTKYSMEDGTLIIKYPKVSDTNSYTCEAKNEVGTDSATFKTYIRQFPKLSGVAAKNVSMGKSVNIECKIVQGKPTPKISWQFMDKAASKFVPIAGVTTTLRITNAENKQAGRYKCVAQNDVGRDEYITTLIVESLPRITINSTTVEGIQGDLALKIPCNVVGVPQPTITWKINGTAITPNEKYSIEDGALVIAKPAVNDSLLYTCEAKNYIGSISATFQARVAKLPEINSRISTILESTEGDALLRIPCIAAGLPKPSITWKLNGHVINPSTKYSMEDGTLIIKYPKVSDTNSYTCEAKNEVGTDSATFKTYIRQFPKLSGVAAKNVSMGKSVNIECKIDQGEPTPTISWQFMDKAASKFVPIAGVTTTLRITNAENIHAGRYKCVAQNDVGRDQYITTLIVESLPRITINSTTVEGIQGDLALKIPCNVVGVPQPTITWKINGTAITPNEKYSIEDGALVIAKPAANDSLLYTCEAKNYIGSISATFQATVANCPKSFGTEHYVYLRQGETRKLECEAYSSESQSVKWFETKLKDSSLTTTSSPLSTTISPLSTTSSPLSTTSSLETSTESSSNKDTSTKSPTIDTGNKESYVQIVNASRYDHDGNYTCHVSDKHGNTQTHTYVVDVGIAPEFVSDDTSISDWQGDILDITQFCDVPTNAKPNPVVQWTFNGKVLTDHNSAGVGQYTCNVSNVHGYVQKRFDVKSSACLITRNLKDAPNMPLILNEEGSWQKFETTKYYTIVKQDVKITLSCPSSKGTSNTFKNFPKKSKLEAICYQEDSFMLREKKYKLSDLQCTNSIQPSIIKKKVKCSTNTSEIIRVGYNVPDFLEAYEVCFDYKLNMPLYTRIIMTVTNNNGLSAGYNWYTYPGIGNEKNERGFTCKDASSSCCYSKSQLVNAIDFNDGPAKKSTFIDPLNVIPAWRPCDTTLPLWEDVNDMVRAPLALYTDIVVWSGTHTMQEKNGVAIPRYLWKVVRLDDDEVMAIVHVNDPKPTKKDIKCKTPDICEQQYDGWFVKDDSTYCCLLPDFLESFDFHDTDIGETLDAALDKMKEIPDSFSF